MRIISGKFGGRHFHPPADKWPTRPTTDIAKEALFNILSHYLDFEAVTVLDLFAGTGSHAYEFVSRGCTEVTVVEKYSPAAKFIQQVAEHLGIDKNIRIVRGDVFVFIKNNTKSYDYIFADPPYDLATLRTIPDLIFQQKMLTENGLLVLEHGPTNDFSAHPHFSEVRKYGKTHFSFFTPSATE